MTKFFLGRESTFAFAKLISVLMLLPATALALEPQEIARRSFPSVVLLTMKDRHGQPLSLGSGFVVRNNVIATNLHVVRGATSGSAKIVGSSGEIDLEGIIAIDETHDLALVKAPLIAPSLPLVEKNTAEIGDTVFAVGNPQGLEGTFSQGIVSGFRSIREGRWIQITAPISPGSSGGPVLNANGEVIGMAVATLTSGQNLNFAIPSQTLKELLNKPEVLQPFYTIKSLPKQRTDAEGFKRPGTSGARGKSPGESDNSLVANAIKVHSAIFEQDSMDYLHNEHLLSFSVVNKLGVPITLVKLLVILYSKDGEPLTYEIRDPDFEIIPPGLAVRRGSRFSDTISKSTSRVEFRVLDFLIWNEQSKCTYVKESFRSHRENGYGRTLTSSSFCAGETLRIFKTGITEEQCNKCLD